MEWHIYLSVQTSLFRWLLLHIREDHKTHRFQRPRFLLFQQLSCWGERKWEGRCSTTKSMAGTCWKQTKRIHGGQIVLFSTDCLWGLKQNPFVWLFVFQFHSCRVLVPTPSACSLSVSLDLKWVSCKEARRFFEFSSVLLTLCLLFAALRAWPFILMIQCCALIARKNFFCYH